MHYILDADKKFHLNKYQLHLCIHKCDKTIRNVIHQMHDVIKLNLYIIIYPMTQSQTCDYEKCYP